MSRKKKETSHDPQALEMIQLQSLGYKNSDIAEMYGVAEETVSRKTSAEKKRLRAMAERMREKGIEPTEIANIGERMERGVAPARATKIRDGEISSLIPKKGSRNPFESITDFSEIAKHSVAAAMVPGSAIAYVLEGFNPDSGKTPEERCEMAMTGGASLFGFIFGLVEAGRALSKENEPKRKIKEVDYEE